MFTNPDQGIHFERPKSFSQDTLRQEKYLELLRKKAEQYTPQELNFLELYSKEEIQADLELVKTRKEQFKENETEQGNRFKRISDVFEGVVVEQAEQNAWFGENVTFYPTSEYDDIVNGVDGVAEFFDNENEGDKNHAALSFDVVFSSDADRIKKKLDRTKNMIEAGQLTEVKYFEGDDGKKASLKAPRIVLGSRLSSAEKLIDLWGKKSPDKNKQLAEHPVQVKLLLESYLQLYHFTHVANESGEIEIAKEYGAMSNRILGIMNGSKKELIERHYNEVSDDIVFETIKNYCTKAKI